jgi:hypothetical protein
MEQELISKVWQLHGALALGGVTPGVLILKESKVSFISAEAELFNVPVAEIKEVSWPFYQFGLVFTAVVNEKKYRFSFAEPGNVNTADNALEKFTGLINNLDIISTGRSAAKEWKVVLKK